MAGKAAVLMTGRMELTEDTELAQRLPGNDQSGLEDILRAFGTGLLNPILTAAPRPSSELEWTRELMIAATGALVPISEYSGGALVTMDPNGQSSKLSRRKYHVDVHIEDGFARTTIDQTYFNHTWSRLDASLPAGTSPGKTHRPELLAAAESDRRAASLSLSRRPHDRRRA